MANKYVIKIINHDYFHIILQYKTVINITNTPEEKFKVIVIRKYELIFVLITYCYKNNLR